MLLPRFFGGEDMAKARPAEGELWSMTRSVAERWFMRGLESKNGGQ